MLGLLIGQSSCMLHEISHFYICILICKLMQTDMQTDAIPSLYALNVAISPVACWFGFAFIFCTLPSSVYDSGRLASVGRL